MPKTEAAEAAARARQPRRKLDGVLLFDKHAGLTSNACLGLLKRLFAAQKAGHTGTLDPFTTGLLVAALGEATKFTQGLLDADKTYLATMRLGASTTTGDTEGEITATAPVDCDSAQVAVALDHFRGEIAQVPPMYSALKREGKPLYEYARAGIEIERQARKVTIHSLDLLSHAGATVVFRVRCSKGTYVRTLAEDIGRLLGCGAHLCGLRREAVGSFSIEAAHDAAALEAMAAAARDACLLPADALVQGLPRIELDAAQAARLKLGQRIVFQEASMAPLEAARAYDDMGLFLGLVRFAAGVVHPLRLIVPAA